MDYQNWNNYRVNYRLFAQINFLITDKYYRREDPNTYFLSKQKIYFRKMTSNENMKG